MILTAIALAASITAGTCAWDPSTQAAYEGDVAAFVERFQDLPLAVRERLRQRVDTHRFDERVEIRRDAVLGAQRYAPELMGVQADRAACTLPARGHWPESMVEPALSYCEAGYCLLVTVNGRHVLLTTRLGPVVEAGAVDPQQLLDQQPTAAGARPPEVVPGRLLVGARAGLSDAEFDKIVKPHGGKLRRIGKSDLFIVDLPAQASEKAVMAMLARHPHLKFAEQDQRVPPAFVPNDPYLGSQWHLGKIGAATAWDHAQGSGVTIAVLDTGVDANHPDLAARLVAGWNFYANSADTSDAYNHGTGVAGAAAAATNNGTGVAGVAGQARIMPIRISDAAGSASYSAMAQGLTHAADQGVRVANISYMVGGVSSVRSAAQYMKNKGGLVFVSSGNTGAENTATATTSLIPVAATDSNDLRAGWSTYGAYVALAAPGVGIYTTTRGGGYVAESGTSFSSPVAAGVAAAVMSANPTLSSSQIESILFATAVDLGVAGRDPYYGHGRLNLDAAVKAALATPAADTLAPSVSVTAPAAGSTVSGLVAVDVSALDNIGVARVELRVNGATVASDLVGPFGFSWDSTRVANGAATLAALAYDAAGNVATSPSVTVSVANAVVADTTPPTVSIASPLGGAVLSGTVAVISNAADNNGTAGLVQALSIDGKQVATAQGGKLSYNWNTRKASAGSHTLSVTATDAAGNRSSSTLTVSVK
jgi:subtilisin family serine protease